MSLSIILVFTLSKNKEGIIMERLIKYHLYLRDYYKISGEDYLIP